jgi:DNA-binding transcriptional MerR regulator
VVKESQGGDLMSENAKVPVGVVARRLGISPQRVRVLMDEGKFGPVERGPYNLRLVSQAAVEAVARDRERRAAR